MFKILTTFKSESLFQKYKIYFIIGFAFTFLPNLTAQKLSKTYKVQIVASSEKVDENVCYTFSIKNEDNVPIGLAGQNYRVYYNSENSIFQENQLTSYLTDGYQPLEIKQHFFDIDASGFGVLPFDHNLGFINLTTDYKLSSDNIITINPNEIVETAQVCFDKGEDINFTWAQEGITSSYATAFVELSLYKDNQLVPAEIVDYKVEGENSTSVHVDKVVNYSIFPNPFTNNLSIDFNKPLTSKAKLYVEDIFGKVHLTYSLEKNAAGFQLDGTSLLPGSYIIVIADENGKESSLKAIKIK